MEPEQDVLASKMIWLQSWYTQRCYQPADRTLTDNTASGSKTVSPGTQLKSTSRYLLMSVCIADKKKA